MTAVGARFVVPPGRSASAPPERRGVPRDGVRLLVAGPTGVEHHRFDELPDLLAPGDLLVVNTSPTLPAALDVIGPDGRPAVLHVSGTGDDGSWIVEPRLPDGPDRRAVAGDRYRLANGAVLTLLRPHPSPDPPWRLWRARTDPDRTAVAHLLDHGRAIAYDYLAGTFPLADRQNVYAAPLERTGRGSAEMASAGRPVTARLLQRLLVRGVVLAPVTLHCGVSSPEAHEPPAPEPFDVPASTAHLVEEARARGARVIAVGTTVVRALESVTAPDGTVRPGSGWTDLVLGPDRPVRGRSGLISGLHPPEASHLQLLDALAGPDLVATAYDAAVRADYRWHEFGDSMLFLP